MPYVANVSGVLDRHGRSLSTLGADHPLPFGHGRRGFLRNTIAAATTTRISHQYRDTKPIVWSPLSGGLTNRA